MALIRQTTENIIIRYYLSSNMKESGIDFNYFDQELPVLS